MSTLFAFLFLASGVALILGLVSPKLVMFGKLPKRRLSVIFLYGATAFMFLIGGAVVKDAEYQQKPKSDTNRSFFIERLQAREQEERLLSAHGIVSIDYEGGQWNIRAHKAAWSMIPKQTKEQFFSTLYGTWERMVKNDGLASASARIYDDATGERLGAYGSLGLRE